jgi:hypothetical protein
METKVYTCSLRLNSNVVSFGLEMVEVVIVGVRVGEA